jgi:hypothetical protein
MNFLEAVEAAGDLPEVPVKILHRESGDYLLMSEDGTIYSDDENVDSQPHFYRFRDECWTVETGVEHA